ncbi:hypothetical protein K491DRAFT_388757 [Lophiostoma macrostomum CBS 122681]|uniref:Uncharacterized protein n=1 Tax=Lophiostoma macrostomum CBS 122681 TaxID=1314788 RepID=A0A6A6TP59_9PLEO|nr:hypothetical protein K491DRAFT_388757 [Lophiostoma macrostomum CBS 122681]
MSVMRMMTDTGIEGDIILTTTATIGMTLLTLFILTKPSICQRALTSTGGGGRRILSPRSWRACLRGYLDRLFLLAVPLAVILDLLRHLYTSWWAWSGCSYPFFYLFALLEGTSREASLGRRFRLLPLPNIRNPFLLSYHYLFFIFIILFWFS